MLWAASAFWLRELDGALDGAVYGGVIGLGFTLTEDVLYVASAGAQGGTQALTGLYVLRTVLGGLGHASFTAMTGLGVGIAVEQQGLAAQAPGVRRRLGSRGRPHFVHNALVTFLLNDGSALVMKLLLFWTFDALFFVLILCPGGARPLDRAARPDRRGGAPAAPARARPHGELLDAGPALELACP